MPKMILNPVETAPSAAPIRIARLPAVWSTAMIHSVKSELQSPKIAWPSGTRPAMTTTAVIASRAAEKLRTRNARVDHVAQPGPLHGKKGGLRAREECGED